MVFRICRPSIEDAPMKTKKLSPEEIEAKANEIVSKVKPPPVDRKKVRWLELKADGKNPKPHSMINSVQAIHELGLDCKLDAFHDRYIVNGTNLGGYHGELSDCITRKIR